MSIVRKATDADLGRISRTVVLAFATEPVMRWLYPDDNDYFAPDSATVRPFLKRLLAHQETFTSDDGVAVAAFVPPGRPQLERPPDPDVVASPPQRQEQFTVLGISMRENTPEELHWYLNVLGTHPDWQRQGLGALMLSSRFEDCDRDGLPIYLETATTQNVAYYSHLGFTIRNEWDIPLNGPHMWGMVRAPRS